MDPIDEQLCNATIDNITKVHSHLSSEAKSFIDSELLVDDIIDYQEAITYYQYIIKDRLYSEVNDEQDFYLIEIIKSLINCFLRHV
jgi:hypothetical protein